eukprot:SAG11_NODE_903_length_6619_cov_31.037270_2_plen_165_part_00
MVALLFTTSLFMASLYLWFVALEGMTMSSDSVVQNLAPIVVFLLAVPISGETVTCNKCLAVALSVGGVFLTVRAADVATATISYGPGSTKSGLGVSDSYITSFISMLLYSVFSVSQKALFPEPPRTEGLDLELMLHSLKLTGLQGAVGTLVFWPLFFILDVTNV